ncbi:MAG: hypothetical protein EGR88_09710 [Ruminococcus sp. SR1/5]|nr:hypothetical protein [Ruminococcus sp.]
MLWEDKENRKGAVKPRPLCTPLGLFLRVPGCGDVWPCWLVFVFFGVEYGTLCRLLQCSCNEALDVRCTSAGVYKVLFATFRLSVELPVQKHTGTD